MSLIYFFNLNLFRHICELHIRDFYQNALSRASRTQLKAFAMRKGCF
jgi:hypothetical protein